MPYQKIVESILNSSEIRISKLSELGSEASFVRAFALISQENAIEVSLEDKGGYLELRIEPLLRSVDVTEVSEWRTVFTGVVQYVEVLERWFIEEPSQRVGRRFAGVRIVGNDTTLEANVDDEMVGAFVARVIQN